MAFSSCPITVYYNFIQVKIFNNDDDEDDGDDDDNIEVMIILSL